MPKTVAGLVVDTLIANGFEHLYCLPGVQNDDFFDALYDRQNALKPVHARHEQGAAYMALGAAMATGRPQAFCVVPGPGVLNTTAALATGYAVNAPMYALVGQIPRGAIGRGHGMLHEIPDQLALLRGLTKQSERIDRPGDAAELLGSTMANVFSGRPRPVGLEVPANVWRKELPEELDGAPAVHHALPSLDEDKLIEAANLLTRAKSPVIVVGGGAQHVSSEVTRLAEMLTAPVVAFRMGHGVVSSRNPLSVTAPVGHDLWASADVVLALGSRLQFQQMQWGVDDDLAIIHIDIDRQEIGRVAPPTVGLHADLADAVPALITLLDGREVKRDDWQVKIADSKARIDKRIREALAPQMSWIDAIRSAMPDEAVFVDELTQVGYVARFAMPVYHPRSFLSSGYQGTLGWGIPTALGAALARPDTPVVSISGDGGALYTISELATAVRHQIPLTVIIFNDGAYGNVRRMQIENYDNRPIASDLVNPDFVKLAASFGVRGVLAETPDELQRQVKASIDARALTVIEVPVDVMPSPWDFVLMPKVRNG